MRRRDKKEKDKGKKNMKKKCNEIKRWTEGRTKGIDKKRMWS